MKVMSAWLKPTWGLAAAMFSTFAAITSWLLSLPPVSGSVGFWLGVVVVVGVGIGLLQALTQIQEVTLSFVPKAVAVGIALIVTGHWMISEMVSFTTMVFDRIPQLLSGG